VIPAPLIVTVALGILAAGLALLMARLDAPGLANVFAVAGALLALGAFVAVAVSTIRRAAQLPPRTRRP
jgi:hypothetical protein